MTARARILLFAARSFVLVFGATALWLAREGMNADGVAYLDASDVYLSGGWPASGSGYWSPLYPMLLAFARLLAGTSAARRLRHRVCGTRVPDVGGAPSDAPETASGGAA